MKYYWYDHMLLRGRGIKINGYKVNAYDIQTCILNHDWEMFQFYSTLLNRIYHSNKYEGKLLFLPKISKKDFMNITHSEYECG